MNENTAVGNNVRTVSQPGLSGVVESCIRFDGLQYLKIARDGYEYHPSKPSPVAFFPAYPLLTWALARLTGLREELALVLACNASLLAAFYLLACYVRARSPGVSGAQIAWVVLAFGLWPTSFFFRMGYSESLFLASVLLTLYGIAQAWALIPLALTAGLATATRPVGVAVAAAFLSYVSSRPGKVPARLAQAIALAPLSCWGLLAYMIYQFVAFGNPIAFVQTQEHWTFRMPDGQSDWWHKWWSLLALEPILGVYDPQSPRFWCTWQSSDDPLFNLGFWNPALFLLATGLLGLGAWRRWLTGPEVVLGVGLLAIPYLTRAYEMSMGSQGRFAAVVIGNYIVIGKLLAAAPAPVAAIAVSISAVLLALWTALFVAGYLFF